MEELLKLAAGWLSIATECVSTLIIGVGVVYAAALTVGLAFGGFTPSANGIDARVGIRLRLGRWLALALEFQLAADILKTAVSPSWDDIGKVAAIIALRTALNYFLDLEIEKAEARMASSTEADVPFGAPSGDSRG